MKHAAKFVLTLGFGLLLLVPGPSQAARRAMVKQIREIDSFGSEELEFARSDLSDALETKKDASFLENLVWLKGNFDRYLATIEDIFQTREDSYRAWIDELDKYGVDEEEIKLVKIALAKSRKAKNEKLEIAYQDYRAVLAKLEKKALDEYQRKKKELADLIKAKREFDRLLKEEKTKLLRFIRHK